MISTLGKMEAKGKNKDEYLRGEKNGTFKR